MKNATYSSEKNMFRRIRIQLVFSMFIIFILWAVGGFGYLLEKFSVSSGDIKDLIAVEWLAILVMLFLAIQLAEGLKTGNVPLMYRMYFRKRPSHFSRRDEAQKYWFMMGLYCIALMAGVLFQYVVIF